MYGALKPTETPTAEDAISYRVPDTETPVPNAYHKLSPCPVECMLVRLHVGASATTF